MSTFSFILFLSLIVYPQLSRTEGGGQLLSLWEPMGSSVLIMPHSEQESWHIPDRGEVLEVRDTAAQ